MELACFCELSSLEQLGLIGASIIGVILFVAGIVLAFRKEPWQGSTSAQIGEKSGAVPGPLAFILIGVVFIGVAGWWLWTTFPAENIKFTQKPWTLVEVKERVQRVSGVRVDLKGEAASFSLDKEFIGACATDVLRSICEFYAHRMRCDHTKPGVFIIEVQP